MCILADRATPCSRTGLPGIQSEHVARNSSERFAVSELPVNVGLHFRDDRPPVRQRRARQEASFELREEIGIVIGLPADHDTVNLAEQLFDLIEARDTAVDENRQVLHLALQLDDAFVIERRSGFPSDSVPRGWRYGRAQ